MDTRSSISKYLLSDARIQDISSNFSEKFPPNGIPGQPESLQKEFYYWLKLDKR